MEEWGRKGKKEGDRRTTKARNGVEWEGGMKENEKEERYEEREAGNGE